ncbi:MAG: protein hydE, partial [Helicobacter sp.]|nr:protein hydE [Helicobacter sp.]
RLVLLDENKPKKIENEYWFMPFCLNNAQIFFKASQEELQALATLEKPIIKLKPKSIFVDFFDNRFVPCILPYEPVLVLLTKFLNDYSGLYLLPAKDGELSKPYCYFFREDFKTQEIKPFFVSVGKNSLVLKHSFKALENPLQEQAILVEEFRKIILKEDLQRVNAIYLGDGQTRFMLYFNHAFKDSLELHYESNIALRIDELKMLNQTTQSLLKNFTKENALLIDTLESLPRESRLSSNILELLGMCGILLDFEEDYNNPINLLALGDKVVKCASDFVGQKGPRIDFKLERDTQGGVYLDTLKTLRSVMSFKLAGVEKELLCFGILDSLAEFYANFARDMEETYNTKGIIIGGKMFLNKQFLDQFIHYFPKDSEIFNTEISDFIH